MLLAKVFEWTDLRWLLNASHPWRRWTSMQFCDKTHIGNEAPCIWVIIIRCSFAIVRMYWYWWIASFDVLLLSYERREGYIILKQKGIKFNYCIIAVAFSKWLAQNDTISTMSVHEMRSSTLYWGCDCQELHLQSNIKTLHTEKRDEILSLFLFLSRSEVLRNYFDL